MSTVPAHSEIASACELLDDYEEARLHVLDELDLLDTPESEAFDRITRMASQLFQTPIAAVSLTDRSRQWFKSHVGTPGREIPRVGAPCAEVTRTAALLLIPDLLEDATFSDCPLAKSGIRFYAGAPLTTTDGHVLGAMCVLDSQPRTVTKEQINSLHDFAAMVMSQVELEHNFGRIDALSGLPNRNQLKQDLEDMGRKEARGARTLVLIDVADPKHFNLIVSVLGTGYIDKLVQASSQAIRQTLGRKSGLYHVGSTSFALLLDEQRGDECQELVRRLTERLRIPVVCQGVPVSMSATFGISPFLLGDAAALDILRTALSAAQDAREADVEHSTYSSDRDKANQRHVTLLTDIPGALKEVDQFAMNYQARVEVSTRVCVGAEALLRWNSPKLGNVSPGEFIPLAEETTLAGPVTNWVIHSVLAQLAKWHGVGLHPCISINVSAANLEQPGFAQSLAETLEMYGVPAPSIELELTEGVFIRHRARVVSQLRDIRAMGIGLAIDDFGTGYSSFSYLNNLPATTVKIDQSFVRSMEGSERDQAVVRSMINIAHDLGYRVVAEGVENAEIYGMLASFGCDEIQGYFISRPLAPAAFEKWLRERPDRHVGSALALLQQSMQSLPTQ